MSAFRMLPIDYDGPTSHVAAPRSAIKIFEVFLLELGLSNAKVIEICEL